MELRVAALRGKGHAVHHARRDRGELQQLHRDVYHLAVGWQVAQQKMGFVSGARVLQTHYQQRGKCRRVGRLPPHCAHNGFGRSPLRALQGGRFDRGLRIASVIFGKTGAPDHGAIVERLQPARLAHRIDGANAAIGLRLGRDAITR